MPLTPRNDSAVASRFQENRDFVESNRAEATRLLRETLFTESPLTLDDVSLLSSLQNTFDPVH